jgi:hypothetical protein
MKPTTSFGERRIASAAQEPAATASIVSKEKMCASVFTVVVVRRSLSRRETDSKLSGAYIFCPIIHPSQQPTTQTTTDATT